MKLRELLSKIFGDLETEVDVTDTEASKLISNDKKVLNNDVKTEVKDTVDKEDKQVKIPKYNKDTLMFDLDSTDDEELKAVLQEFNNTMTSKNNNSLISSAIDTKIAGLKLNKGITVDAVKALLDKSGIAVTDGKVTGVDEAVANLQKAQAGLFVTDNKVVSNPVMEGFAPQNANVSGAVPNSFTEAFAMMDE